MGMRGGTGGASVSMDISPARVWETWDRELKAIFSTHSRGDKELFSRIGSAPVASVALDRDGKIVIKLGKSVRYVWSKTGVLEVAEGSARALNIAHRDLFDSHCRGGPGKGT